MTLRFNEDLAAVLKREVMDPIGVSATEWAWRDNAYRAKTINGLKSREFASGITITHRALARIGYLYLRGGEWNGRRILSREFIRAATRPTDLARASCPITRSSGAATAGAPFARCRRTPTGRSAWAIASSWSARAWTSSPCGWASGPSKSQLPGGDGPEEWGKRVAGFVRLVVAAARDARPRQRGDAPRIRPAR